MDKDIGFNRNIYLAWLDAAATLRGESDDVVQIRARLDPVVGQRIRSAVNRRKAIDILINVWCKSAAVEPGLHAQAVRWARETQAPGDRIWLHYGLTLLYYSFFREVTAAIGRLGRYEETLQTPMIKRRLVSARGPLGSLEKAVERIVFSLRDWGLLAESGRRSVYLPQCKVFSASSVELEAWLLACALCAHPAQEMPFADLLRLPELYAFGYTLGVDVLREHRWFAVQRQGAGWDMVRCFCTGDEMRGYDDKRL